MVLAFERQSLNPFELFHPCSAADWYTPETDYLKPETDFSKPETDLYKQPFSLVLFLILLIQSVQSPARTRSLPNTEQNQFQM
jgi:hypothetical protein